MSDSSSFTPETARAALNAILEALELEENAVKINEAKVGAGNDMLKVMQYVFPLIVQVEMDVIKKFGFTDNREGIIQFTQLICSLEKEDDVVTDLHNQIRSYYLPPVTLTNDIAL
ncbi:chromosome 12 open reading frame 57 [Nesidiocoris tenuis]|nr:chromosome 12 open reading frame 57 [Nesidiocoris tenuis]